MSADFPEIYQPDTPERVRFKQVEQEKATLIDSLSQKDFMAAGKFLRKVGACEWQELMPEAKLTLRDKEGNVQREYFPQYDVADNAVKLTLNEVMPGGGGGLFTRRVVEYVPRLTVEAPPCQPPADKPN
ncbi:MAG: hypothetical protein JST01_09765 [Cyanobacteria bacterium SZAS TMP-1]|nr:hypothetical protein [Cyanobacteria bacterium SZAS TMP-1]